MATPIIRPPKLTCDGIRTVNFADYLVLRVDFDNDRHHAVYIEPPYTVGRVADALIELARNLQNDPYLRG